MVSFNVFRSTASGAYVEGVCLATDEKPVTGIANGSILYAVDASDGSTTRFMYDQNSMSWIEAECPCSGGSGGSGGGGSGSGGILVVHDEVNQLDATWEQIRDAALQGPVVLLFDDPDAKHPYFIASLSSLDIEPGSDDGEVPTPDTYEVFFGNNSYSATAPDGVLYTMA